MSLRASKIYAHAQLITRVAPHGDVLVRARSVGMAIGPLVLCVVLAATGCADDERGEMPRDGGGAAVPLDAGLDASSVMRSALSGEVREGNDGGPIEEARVCILEHDDLPCARTDRDGRYSLRLPEQSTMSSLALNFTAPGYLGYTDALASHTVSVSVELEDEASASAWVNPAGFRFPAPDRGLVQLAVYRTHHAAAVGATVAVDDPAARVVYMNDQGSFDPALSAVGEKGSVLIGQVRPGRLMVSIAGCTPLPLGPGYLNGNPSTVVVAAGSLTTVHVVCADD